MYSEKNSSVGAAAVTTGAAATGCRPARISREPAAASTERRARLTGCTTEPLLSHKCQCDRVMVDAGNLGGAEGTREDRRLQPRAHGVPDSIGVGVGAQPAAEGRPSGSGRAIPAARRCLTRPRQPHIGAPGAGVAGHPRWMSARAFGDTLAGQSPISMAPAGECVHTCPSSPSSSSRAEQSRARPPRDVRDKRHLAGDQGCLGGRRRRGILGYRERVSVHVLVGGFSDFAIVDDRRVVGALRDRRGLDGTLSGLRLAGRLVASERSLILWSTRVVLAVSCGRNLRLTDRVAARRQGG